MHQSVRRLFKSPTYTKALNKLSSFHITEQFLCRSLCKIQHQSVDTMVKSHKCFTSQKKIAYYILDDDIAGYLANIIKKNITGNSFIIEVNPGPGILTKHLLNSVTNQLVAVESHKEFLPYLEEIQKTHKDKEFSFIHHDLFAVFKYYKVDDKRIQEKQSKLVSLIPDIPWRKDVAASVIGILPPNNETYFLHHLAHNFCHTEGFFKPGRIQWFLFISPSFYRKLLAADNRRMNILYELFFNVNVCHKIPISSVYPKYPRKSMIRKVEYVDPNMTYFVHITPKSESKDLLKSDDLFKFSLFLKQLLAKKQLRLIPRMEELVPGCGIYLIKEGFNMMQFVRDVSSTECLKIFKMLSTIPEYYNSGWRNFLISEGLIVDDDNDDSSYSSPAGQSNKDLTQDNPI